MYGVAVCEKMAVVGKLQTQTVGPRVIGREEACGVTLGGIGDMRGSWRSMELMSGCGQGLGCGYAVRMLTCGAELHLV